MPTSSSSRRRPTRAPPGICCWPLPMSSVSSCWTWSEARQNGFRRAPSASSPWRTCYPSSVSDERSWRDLCPDPERDAVAVREVGIGDSKSSEDERVARPWPAPDPDNTAFLFLSFEGPDPYSFAGGLSTRISEFTRALAVEGFRTHLLFVGEPTAPPREERYGGQLGLHRFCQRASRRL